MAKTQWRGENWKLQEREGTDERTVCEKEAEGRDQSTLALDRRVTFPTLPGGKEIGITMCPTLGSLGAEPGAEILVQVSVGGGCSQEKEWETCDRTEEES